MCIFKKIKNYSSFNIHHSLFTATSGCTHNPNIVTNINKNNNKIYNRRVLIDKTQITMNKYKNVVNNESEILEYINSTLNQKINKIESGLLF